MEARTAAQEIAEAVSKAVTAAKGAAKLPVKFEAQLSELLTADLAPKTKPWRLFLRRHTPMASGPIPSWAGFFIEQIGIGLEELEAAIQRLEIIIMTSAESTDQQIQDAVATLVAFETAAQSSLTTLGNDLATVLADIQAAPNAVQASTVANLQNAITTLGTLGTSLSSNVTSIDTAVNPPAPAPAPAPSGT